VGKRGVLEDKNGNRPISETRIGLEERLLWRTYRKSSTLFRFFGRRHISTSETAVFCLIFAYTAQQSVLL